MKNNIKSILSLFFCISLCCCSTSESDSAKNKKQEPSLETLFGNDTTLHSGFHTTTSNDEYFDNGNIYSEDEEIQETDEDDEEEKEYIPNFKQRKQKYSIEITVENELSLEAFNEVLGEQCTPELYSNSFSYIVICGVDENGNKIKFSFETA